MAIKNVTALRKSGKLEEAYALARKDLLEDPNEWTCMSMFWVLRDIVQKWFLPENRLKEATTCLEQMNSLLPNMMDDSGAGERAYQILYKSIMPNADKIKAAYELSKTNPNKAYIEITSELGNDGSSINEALHEDFGWIIYRYLKADVESMQSIDVRRKLRDYMLLKNDRPSLLHSMILNFALNFSKDHKDFKFYNFLMMWSVENLREEDYNDGYSNQGTIPSLISRICRAIIESGEPFDVGAFISKFDTRSCIVLDHLRQACFWKLMNLHRKGDMQTLMSDFNTYANAFSAYGASHWHSEILKLANRFMTESHAPSFIPFFIKWNDSGNLRPEDWKKETDDKGNEFPSLAVRSSKKFFELLRQDPKLRRERSVVEWIKSLYAKIKEHDTADDWSARNYATTCIWCGDNDEAVSVYRKLLEHMGDKYYLWAELAGCITDNNLRMGLLLKSKGLERNEDFLGNIHLSLAYALLNNDSIEKAKNELSAYAEHYAKKSWSLSDAYYKLNKAIQECHSSNQELNENELIAAAEDFVYSEYKWKVFVLTGKWTHEGVERCSFSDGENLNFIVKSKRFPLLKKAKAGDIISVKCSVEKEQVADPNSSSWQKQYITKYNVTPFILKKSSSEPWSILPLKYGVVDYINKEKHVLHIITQESKQTYFTSKTSTLDVNSFVKFREYSEMRNEKTETRIAEVVPCRREEALKHMNSRIVVVDDVNDEKRLFHIVMGPGLVSDIVRFDQTDLRPSIGQFLKITYCIKKNKEGKKRIKFLDIQETTDKCEQVTKEISGKLEMKYKDDYWEYEDDHVHRLPDFAFIEDYYVHRNILRKYNITQDRNVTAKLVLGGDNKWKVFELKF